MSEPITVIGAVIDGPIAYREFPLEPSGCVGYCPHDFMHRHHYDHEVHVLDESESDVELAVEGEPFKTLRPGDKSLVKAMHNHFIRSVGPKPAKVRCEFQHRDKDGNVVPLYDVAVCVPEAYDFAAPTEA